MRFNLKSIAGEWSAWPSTARQLLALLLIIPAGLPALADGPPHRIWRSEQNSSIEFRDWGGDLWYQYRNGEPIVRLLERSRGNQRAELYDPLSQATLRVTASEYRRQPPGGKFGDSVAKGGWVQPASNPNTTVPQLHATADGEYTLELDFPKPAKARWRAIIEDADLGEVPWGGLGNDRSKLYLPGAPLQLLMHDSQPRQLNLQLSVVIGGAVARKHEQPVTLPARRAIRYELVTHGWQVEKRTMKQSVRITGMTQGSCHPIGAVALKLPPGGSVIGGSQRISNQSLRQLHFWTSPGANSVAAILENRSSQPAAGEISVQYSLPVPHMKHRFFQQDDGQLGRIAPGASIVDLDGATYFDLWIEFPNGQRTWLNSHSLAKTDVVATIDNSTGKQRLTLHIDRKP